MPLTGASLKKLLVQLPNAVVFAVLVGLLAWGHAYHWHLPKFSELMRDSGEILPEVDPSAMLHVVSRRPLDGGPLEGNELAPRDPAENDPADGVPSLVERVTFESKEAIVKSGVEVAVVEERPIAQNISALAQVNYDQTLLAQLTARVRGTVWSVHKQVGEAIKKGELLAIIEALDVGKAKSEFLQAVVAAELRAETLEQLQKIPNSVSARTFREAQANAREALIQLFNAQQTLTNLGLPVRLADVAHLHDEELVERVHFLGLPKDVVSSLDPQTATANLVPLVAPFDGLVIGREIVVGELVEPSSQAQFVIADVSRMWVDLNIRKEDSGKIRRGQEVVFSFDGVPGEVRSKISWISTEVDKETRTIQARADVSNPLIHGVDTPPDGQRLLRANMFGEAKVRVLDKPKAIVVPNTALHRDGTHHVVFVRINERTFEPRVVRLGISGLNFTEVLTGVSPGEVIAAQGSHVLKAEVLKDRLATSH
jgi:membrane fusion protein, heavy metal efflux system